MIACECGEPMGKRTSSQNYRRSSDSYAHDGECALLFNEDLSSYVAEFGR